MFEDRKLQQIALARVLLDDIAHSRLAPRLLLIKARRLALLVSAQETFHWLGWELNGYSGQNELELKYLKMTGRASSDKHSVFHEGAFPAIKRKSKDLHPSSGNRTCPESEIRARVLALLKQFVEATYFALVLERLMETVLVPDQCLGTYSFPKQSRVQQLSHLYYRIPVRRRSELVHVLRKVWNSHPGAWNAQSGPDLDQECAGGSTRDKEHTDMKAILCQLIDYLKQCLPHPSLLQVAEHFGESFS